LFLPVWIKAYQDMPLEDDERSEGNDQFCCKDLDMKAEGSSWRNT